MIPALIVTIIWGMVFFAVFGLILKVSGSSIGQSIMSGAVTVFILLLGFMFVLSVDYENRVSTIPFYNLDQWGTLSNMIKAAPGEFIMNITRLLTVTFIMALIKKTVPIKSGSVILTKITPTLVLVVSALCVNIFVYPKIVVGKPGEILFQVANGLVGGGIVVTEVFSLILGVIGKFTGFKANSSFIQIFSERFPDSAIGQAIKVSVTSSAIFVVYLLILEKAVGSIQGLIQTAYSAFLLFLAPMIMILGIVLMIKAAIKR